MGITNIRAALEKRYAALSGQLEQTKQRIDDIHRSKALLPQLEAELPRLDGLIGAVEMLLRDGYPDWSPEATPAKKPWEHGIPIPFGSCGRRARALIRDAARPMTAREVATELLREQGCDDPTPDVLRRTQTAVEASFRKFKGRGIESSGKYPMQWRSTAAADMPFDP